MQGEFEGLYAKLVSRVLRRPNIRPTPLNYLFEEFRIYKVFASSADPLQFLNFLELIFELCRPSVCYDFA